MASKAVRFTEDCPQVFEYEQIDLPAEEKKTKEQSPARQEWFMDFMAVSMGIRTPEQRLEEVSFEGVAKYIASGKCSNIITMAGAGISTSAGIPDYRSAGTGLFDQLKAKFPNVQHITDLFNIQFFLKDPKPFYVRSKRFFEVSLKPTPCHYFIRLLYEKGLLLRHFTQNIDTLERLAGLPSDKVVEAHGSYYISHCMLCDQQYSFDWLEERVLKNEVVTCEEADCTGVIKPDIVMYGESLDERFGERAEEDTLKCDLLIIMGTSLEVQPFASLTSKVKTSTPRLFINLERGKTGKRHPMTDLMFGGGFDFDSEENIRDVFKQEKCDEACYELADQVGWGEELRSLVTSEHARIEEEDRRKGKKPAPPLTALTTAPPLDDQHTATPRADSTPPPANPTPEKPPGKIGNKAKTKDTVPTKEPSPRPSNKSSGSKQGDPGKDCAPAQGSHHGAHTRASAAPGKQASKSGANAPRSKPAASASAASAGSSTTPGAGGASAGKTTATAGAKNSLAAADKTKQSNGSGNRTKQAKK